jgi:Kelch motif protein/galactose oxidase-like protein
MRKSRFLSRVFLSAFVAATFATAAQAAPQPSGTCTPPGAWEARTDFPGTIVRAWGQFFPSDGKFYLLGGRPDDNVLGDDFVQVNIYDPATDTWSVSASAFEDTQVNNMVGGVLDFGGTQYIVAVGGSASTAVTTTSDVRQYDPVADTITVLTDDPWPGNDNGTNLPGGAAVIDNKLYVFGGFNVNTSMLDTTWVFDPSAIAGSRWTALTATLPVPLGYIPTAASNGLVYMFGGSNYDPNAASPVFDTDGTVSYDPVTDTLAPLTAIPRVVGETRAVTMLDGTMWVLGGGRIAPNPSNEVDIYDPVGDAWTLGPPMTNPRRNFAADVDPATGNIWAIGGYDVDNATTLSFNEQFTACNAITDRIFADGFDGPPI